VPNDYQHVNCASCREVISADLDGEASADELTLMSHHLVRCAACRTYRAEVTGLHRAVRVVPAEPVPDLTASILAAHPATGTAPNSWSVWRLGLILIGVAQILAGVAHLSGDHLARDQASWEMAMAAGFLWAAWRPTRTAGLVPVTAVLTALLVVNGGLAVANGGTHHLLAPLGLALLVLARREHEGIRTLAR